MIYSKIIYINFKKYVFFFIQNLKIHLKKIYFLVELLIGNFLRFVTLRINLVVFSKEGDK